MRRAGPALPATPCPRAGGSRGSRAGRRPVPQGRAAPLTRGYAGPYQRPPPTRPDPLRSTRTSASRSRRDVLRRPPESAVPSNGRIIGDIPTLPAPEGEVVPGGQRGGMIRAEHPNAVGEQPFELGDRAGDIPTLPAAGGQVVAGGQRGGMIRAEHPRCAVSSRSNSVTAPATSPPSPRQPAAKRCSSESMSRQNRSARRRFKQRMASLWDLPATIFVS